MVGLKNVLRTLLADMRAGVVGWVVPAGLLLLYPAVATVFNVEYLDEYSLLVSILVLGTALVLIRRKAATVQVDDVGGPAQNMLQASISFKKKLKNFMCFNQGELAQFSFLVAEKHKALKDAKNMQPIDLERLSECKKDLDHFHDTRFNRIMGKNHDYIQKFFIDNGKKPRPRIVLKWCRDSRIGDLYRHGDQYYCEEGVTQNTGAVCVLSSGDFYICEDIAAAIIAGEYKNSRIDNSKVKALVEEVGSCDEISDKEWRKCWFPNQDSDRKHIPPPEDSCYRSTMLIPLTLLNNDLNESFRKHFDIPIKMASAPDYGKAIYGILCFDSTEKNYFSDEINRHLGYVWADIISLYLITAATYTSYSKTYKEVESMLEAGHAL